MPTASRRYKAPSANGAILAEPALTQVPELVVANRRLFAHTKYDGMRSRARQEIWACVQQWNQHHSPSSPSMSIDGLSDATPLLLSGHQPELFHPGVWAKNFALAGIARRIGGMALNLIVDNDTLKSAALKFPTWESHDPRSVRLEAVPFDVMKREVPYEVRGVDDPGLFVSFAERARSHWQNWGYTPLLDSVWPTIANDSSPTIGERFVAARRRQEFAWGCYNAELPVSVLAKTEAFRQFARDILHDLPRFTAIYNAAIQQYRVVNKVHSKNHPAPELQPGEMPFWRITPQGRTPFFAMGNELPDVRPRALTLTLFCRVFLGDFFIHGIGGGKYDEVTDTIIRNYYGIDAPAFQVLSATIHLPLPAFPTTLADVLALRYLERDLHWNPQRHLRPEDLTNPDVQLMVRSHHELETREPSAWEERRDRFRAFRSIGEKLLPHVEGTIHETQQQLRQAQQEAAANATMLRRDFAWVLYPEALLRPEMQQFL